MKLHSLASVITLGLAACGEEPELPPIVWEGDHLRFGTDADDSTICAGTWPYLDSVVGHLGEVFARPDAVIDYYWVPDTIETYCDGPALGCSGEHLTFSRNIIHQHELVHSLRYPSLLYRPFEEGLAEAFGDDWDPPPYSFEGEIGDLLRNPDQHFPGNGYALAGHFVSYLRAEHGLEPLLALDAATDYQSSFSGTEAAFTEVFGITLDNAITDYEASYPRCPLRGYRDKTVDCDRNVIAAPTEPGTQIEHIVPLSCNDPTVLGPRFDERWNTASVEIQVPGGYYFIASPEGDTTFEFAKLTRCDADCVGFADEVFNVTTGTEIGFGDCLDPGRYLFRFAASGPGQGQVRLLVSHSDGLQCD